MTRLLVMSDSHGEVDKIESVLKKETGNFDFCFHLGDRSRDMKPFQSSLPQLIQVKGNIEMEGQDVGEIVAYERLLELEGFKILVTHGHQYSVHFTMNFLKKAAVKKNIRLVLFGHTHTSEYFEEDGIAYLNPGALKNNDYGFITLDNGKILGKNFYNI